MYEDKSHLELLEWNHLASFGPFNVLLLMASDGIDTIEGLCLSGLEICLRQGRGNHVE